MQILDGRLVLAATDLTDYLVCRHLTALGLAVARGEIAAPALDPHAAVVARRGDAHERAFLDRLREVEGRRVVEIPRGGNPHGPAAAAAATRAALRAGAEAVYQGVFFDGQWLGYADFLLRVPRPSALGAWSYEVIDTKLARRARPYFVLQLCFYSEQLAHVQGAEPEAMHLVLGTTLRETYRWQDFAAYYRRVKARLVEHLAAAPGDTYPEPVEHCTVCRWAPRCDARRLADDHPSLVAGIRRDQIVRLARAGVTTLAALGRADPARLACGIPAPTLRTLHHQARLQLAERESGTPRYELLEPAPERGLALLPRPSPGDVFLDLEGDPYVEDGLEYLFGVGFEEDGRWCHRPFWAHTSAQERKAFAALIDLIAARRARHPGLHVYHYAAYEPTALKRLAGRYGTREEALDDLLRNGVLVDLYRVVRQGLRASQPSYSLKQLEPFYRTSPRRAGITDGNESIVAYERWLELRDDALLAEIQAYNAEDVRSTRELHAWLLGLRVEAEQQFGAPIAWMERAVQERSEKALEVEAEVAELVAALTAGLPADLDAASSEERARGLLAHLLEYHRREARPAWWAFFERCAKDTEELVEDAEAIGDLTGAGTPAEKANRSLVHTLRFPPQQHKLREGLDVVDPATARSAGTIVALDDAEGTLRLRRGPTLARTPLPRALIPGGPIETKAQRAALRRLTAAVIRHGVAGPGPYRALRDVLLAAPPRIRGVPSGTPLRAGDAARLVADLDDSHLFIQGPPGSGKTWTGAQLVVHLLRLGKRVGVAATSHKAIHTLLHEVEAAAATAKVRFRGLKKSAKDDSETEFRSRQPQSFIANSPDRDDFAATDAQLVAGTAWLFARAALDGAFDHLVVDEAGQVSLADALAMGTAARNLVLLGDPQQLAQVSQGAHPDGAAASVLEHLLGAHDTIPATHGLFLERTRRMHPDVCGFVSELCYEGRLGWIEECARQGIEVRPGTLGGTGLRFLGVEHQGNAQASSEEADAIAAALTRLLGARLTPKNGSSRPLAAGDVMVVTPYNAQVRCLRQRLPADVRVGTVDKFQGQEAPVVFFSLATSSGADLPRRLEFLFSRNRLNVAVSRAECLAVLVASPRLLDAACRTVEQMRMVNGLCRLVEVAASARSEA